jgi:hypothetical protein
MMIRHHFSISKGARARWHKQAGAREDFFQGGH